MQPSQFSCPRCRSRLRVRDRSQVGRTIDCPECRTPLKLASDAGGRIAAFAVEPEGIDVAATRKPRPADRLKSPTTIAWASMLLAAGALFGIIFWPNQKPSRETARDVQQPAPVVPPALDPPPIDPDEPPLEDPQHGDDLAPDADDLPIDPVLAADVAPALDPDPESDPDAAPIDVPLAEDGPRFDIAAQLRQPVLEYSQPKPAAVRELLKQIAEMSAVPIDASAVEAAPWNERLDREVTISLTGTSVGGILQAVVQQAELRTELGDDAILVLPPHAGP
ncbi:MAG: hypothetical protein KF774_18580 [Planctomyces sp.]|nr:hypothetical protein [Planctomyces sp.]